MIVGRVGGRHPEESPEDGMEFDPVEFVTVGLNGLTQAAIYFIVKYRFFD